MDFSPYNIKILTFLNPMDKKGANLGFLTTAFFVLIFRFAESSTVQSSKDITPEIKTIL
jgi:hypothetical protein